MTKVARLSTVHTRILPSFDSILRMIDCRKLKVGVSQNFRFGT